VAGDGARVPTAVVLAAVSAMVSIGAVAFLLARPADGDKPEAATGAETYVDQRTAERAAESFLDAWRKREHATALALSRGEAREAVRARQRSDAALGEEERQLKQQVWDAMASTRLALSVHESETLDGGRVAIRGVAQGRFVGDVYRREVRFVVAPEDADGGDRWVVEHMRLGDILSDVPGVLQMPTPGQRGPGPLD
jgi:hypothetical protein